MFEPSAAAEATTDVPLVALNRPAAVFNPEVELRWKHIPSLALLSILSLCMTSFIHPSQEQDTPSSSLFSF